MKRSGLALLLPGLLLLPVASRGAAQQPAANDTTVGSSPGTTAEATQSPDLRGSFLYTPEGSDSVEAVIKAGTSKMSFIKKPFARSRLKKTNVPYHIVKIAYTDTTVSIEMDSRAAIVTPADGQAIKWRREDGELFDVNTVWEDGKLKETFVAGDGSRENLFSISPDGQTLTMQVTIRSPQLPAPIVYRLEYKREA